MLSRVIALISMVSGANASPSDETCLLQASLAVERSKQHLEQPGQPTPSYQFDWDSVVSGPVVPEHAFADLPNGTLEIKTHGISQLGSDIWGGNPQRANVQQVWIAHGTLTAVPPDMFSGMTALKVAHLGANQIADLHPDTFKDNVNLVSLHLGMNALTQLPDSLFEGNLVQARAHGHNICLSIDNSVKNKPVWLTDTSQCTNYAHPDVASKGLEEKADILVYICCPSGGTNATSCDPEVLIEQEDTYNTVCFPRVVE